MKASLSVAFAELRGKAGPVVVTKGRSGLVVRPRVSGPNPRTPAQVAARQNFTRATTAFKGLTAAQFAQWSAYAEATERVDPVSGQSYHPAPFDLFVALTTKFLQANPEGTIPLTPPPTPFAGDSIVLSVVAAAPGVISFQAPGPNAAGVTVELLLQPLATVNRRPQPLAYRTKGFHAFAPGSLSKEVAVPAGHYAAAYRFVRAATGQSTPLIPLGVLTVV